MCPGPDEGRRGDCEPRPPPPQAIGGKLALGAKKIGGWRADRLPIENAASRSVKNVEIDIQVQLHLHELGHQLVLQAERRSIAVVGFDRE